MAPINDLLANAISVDVTGETFSGTIVDATDTGEVFTEGGVDVGVTGPCDINYNGPSVWYEFFSPDSITVTIEYVSHSYAGPDNRLYAELFASIDGPDTGDCCELFRALANDNWFSSDAVGGDPTSLTLTLEGGRYYYLYVANYTTDLDDTGTFTLRITSAGEPVENDSPQDATAVTRCQTVSASTAGASVGAGESGPTAWWKFTPSIAETLTFRIISSSGFGANGGEIIIYEGPHSISGFGDLTLVSAISQATADAVDILVDPTKTYYLAVHDFDGDNLTGTVQFTICDAPEPEFGNNDTCASARTLSAPNGFVFGDNRLAAYESPDRIYRFSYSLSGGADPQVAGRSVWYRWTAPIDCRIEFGIDTNVYQGFAEDGWMLGLFRDCTNCVPDTDELGSMNNRDFGETRFLAPINWAEGGRGSPSAPAVGIDLRKGETVFVEVASFSGASSEPPSPLPDGGRFKLHWKTYAAGMTDAPRRDCLAPGALSLPPDINDGTLEPVRGDSIDYVETNDGALWMLWATLDGGRKPIVSRLKAGVVTDFEIPTDDRVGEDEIFDGWGVFFEERFSLDTDGTLVWCSVIERYVVENPWFCGDAGDSLLWAPHRVGIFQSSGGAFSRIGTIPADTNNSGFSLSLQGFYSGIRCTAAPAQPGVLWLMWEEEGHEGFHLFGDDCEDNYGVRWYVGAFGPNAPAMSGALSDNYRVVYTDSFPDNVFDDDHVALDPYHNGEFTPTVHVTTGNQAGAWQLVNDTGVPYCFRAPPRVPPEVVGSPGANALATSIAPYVEVFRIGSDGTLTLVDTIEYEAPTDAFPDPGSVDFDSRFTYVGSLSVEPNSHLDPIDGKRIRYVLIAWQLDDGVGVGVTTFYRVRTNVSAIDFFDFDGDRATSHGISGGAGESSFGRTQKRIFTDRFNQPWMLGNSFDELFVFDRKCHIEWWQYEMPRAKEGVDLNYRWGPQVASSAKWHWDEVGGRIIIPTPGSSGGSENDPPATPSGMLSSPGFLTDSTTPGDYANFVAHGYEWISFQVVNGQDPSKPTGLANRAAQIVAAKAGGFRNAGVWGVVYGQEADPPSVKKALYLNFGRLLGQEAVSQGAGHVIVDAEIGYKHTRADANASGENLGKYIIDGLRQGGWEGPVHLSTLGTPTDPVGGDFEYDVNSFLATGGGVMPQAFPNQSPEYTVENCMTYWLRFAPRSRINMTIASAGLPLGILNGSDYLPHLQAAGVLRNLNWFLAETTGAEDLSALDVLTLEEAPPVTGSEGGSGGEGTVDDPGPSGDFGVYTNRALVRFGGLAVAIRGDAPVRRGWDNSDRRFGPYFGLIEIKRNGQICTHADVPYEPDELTGVLFIQTTHRAELSAAGPGSGTGLDMGGIRYRAEKSGAAPGSGSGVSLERISFRAG